MLQVTIKLFVLSILTTEVMNLRLKEDDIKRVLDLMQHQMLEKQETTHDLKFYSDVLNNPKKSFDRELHYLDQIQNVEDNKNENRHRSHDYENGKNIHEKSRHPPLSIVLFRPKDNEEFKVVFLSKILEKVDRYWKRRPKNFFTSQITHYKSKQPKSKHLNFATKLLDKFSKLYLILNTSPDKTIVNDEDLNQISTLLSKNILLTKVRKNQRETGKKYYKGFALKDDILSSLRRRGSDEYISRKYSAEDDYRPKQSRNRHGDSIGGRTAVPFTGKHRDVFEDY